MVEHAGERDRDAGGREAKQAPMSDFGDLLRHARAYKGVTLREAERETRISRHHLAALEYEEFSELPPLTYARGIVRKYAEYLGLDPVMVLAKFEDVHGQRSGGFQVVPAVKPLDVPSHWAPNFAIIAFMVIMSAVLFAWMYSAFLAPPDEVPAAVTPVADVAGSQGGNPLPPLATPEPTPAAGGPFIDPAIAPVTTPTTTPAPTAARTSTPPPTPTASPTPDVHDFVVSTTADVWVDVTVDGEPVLSETLPEGSVQSFSGREMTVSSGNSLYVWVSVDGGEAMRLGDAWDAEATFP